MGNCHRRQSNVHLPLVEDKAVQTMNTCPNKKFIKVVNKIKLLLFARRIFAQSGSYLNTSISRRSEQAHVRAVMTHIFIVWPKTILKNTKSLFSHLKRRQGKLVYAK